MKIKTARKDYARHGFFLRDRYRRTLHRKKNRIFFGISKMFVMQITVILSMLFGCLYLIAHNSDKLVNATNYNKKVDSLLPSKPKERWRYIKELENHQISTKAQKTTNNLKIVDKTHLVKKISIKKKKKNMYWHSASSNPDKLIHNEQKKIPNIWPHLITQTSHNLLQERSIRPLNRITSSNIISQFLSKQIEQNVTMLIGEKKMVTKEQSRRWLVQCASCRIKKRAESIRAQLALFGIESQVAISNGWNRVVLGPYTHRIIASKVLQRMRNTGISNCILVAN
ncbi:SPOR domain-containing protein [Sodalis sp. CWE]|uniref:SPOR domain-containing protein n=1 Tax=Sodalis sp. CWE TaxID=2803816 RepID=UPI001C7DE3B4|nr:SPOR domain-containing protein [Sodalis sp. CWE]MBX4180683.1 SPOR domain-containing protein [Sodalis sp. CWE]